MLMSRRNLFFSSYSLVHRKSMPNNIGIFIGEAVADSPAYTTTTVSSFNSRWWCCWWGDCDLQFGVGYQRYNRYYVCCHCDECTGSFYKLLELHCPKQTKESGGQKNEEFYLAHSLLLQPVFSCLWEIKTDRRNNGDYRGVQWNFQRYHGDCRKKLKKKGKN